MGAYIHSHSALKTFRTCPRKFLNDYILREYTSPFVQSAKGEWGNKVHKAVENAWLFREPTLAPGFESMQWLLDDHHKIEQWLVNMQPGMEFDSAAELQLGIDRDGDKSGFFNEGVYFRGKLDKAFWCGDMGVIDDLKTGNPAYKDMTQLETQAIMLFADKPHINRILGRLTWTERPGKPDVLKMYRSAEHVGEGIQAPLLLDDMKTSLLFELNRIDKLLANNDLTRWPKTSNGLCQKYCDIPVTVCSHSGRQPAGA